MAREIYAMCPNEYFSIRVPPGKETTRLLAAHDRQSCYFLLKPSFAGSEIEAVDEQIGRGELVGRRGLP